MLRVLPISKNPWFVRLFWSAEEELSPLNPAGPRAPGAPSRFIVWAGTQNSPYCFGQNDRGFRNKTEDCWKSENRFSRAIPRYRCPVLEPLTSFKDDSFLLIRYDCDFSLAIPKDGPHIRSRQAGVTRRSEHETIVVGGRQSIGSLPSVGLVLSGRTPSSSRFELSPVEIDFGFIPPRASHAHAPSIRVAARRRQSSGRA